MNEPRIGRPPRSSKPSTDRIEIRVTAAERRAWERGAAEDGMSLSAWIRSRCSGTPPWAR